MGLSAVNGTISLSPLPLSISISSITYESVAKTLVACVISLLLAICFKTLATSLMQPTLPVPPGPKPRFFSGNVHQLSKSLPWMQYAGWAVEYGQIMRLYVEMRLIKCTGPIIYFHVFGRKFIVLNSAEAVTDLLESRSSRYSDRPHRMMNDLAGRGMSVFNISTHVPRFKRYRRRLHWGLNARATQNYRSLQESESRLLLQGLLKTPENFITHIQKYGFCHTSFPEI
jgi:hypothetical protein